MAYAPAVPDSERLPWLNDDIRPMHRHDLRPLIFWTMLAVLLVAGASYWLGMKTGSLGETEAAEFAGPSTSTTIDLPEPSSARPLVEDVKPAPMPEVKPVAQPAEVALPRQRSERPARRRAQKRKVLKPTPIPDDSLRDTVEKQEAVNPPAPKAPATQLWPAAISDNAYGRVVRIGTFSTRYKAKRAWHDVVRAYPGMRRLKAVVVANPSLRNGQTYYRLQFGTSSQAHSAVLCQRMRTIGQSCVVVGLPGGVS